MPIPFIYIKQRCYPLYFFSILGNRYFLVMLIFIWLQSLTWLGARFERLNYCFFCTNQWRALVSIGPGSSRCQYGEQPLQMNKIEGPGGKSIFFPVFFLAFWLFYCIRKDQPLTTDLVWGLRILESLLTAERLTSKYSVACSAHTGVGIDYLMFASFLQGWRISVGDSEFWGLRNK